MTAKICLLTSVHDPTVTDDRIYKEAHSLLQAGYQVELIAPHPKSDVISGVPVRAVPKPSNRLSRFTKTVLMVYREALRQRADVYHFHDPELIPVGLLLKLAGSQVIYDVREDFPLDILTREWIGRWLRRPVAKFTGLIEALGAYAFDGIFSATPSISQRFPKLKTILVQNFPLLDVSERSNSVPYPAREAVVFFYGYYINAMRGVKEVVEAMALLPTSFRCRFRLAGMFEPPALEGELRRSSGWDRVDYVGFQSRRQIAEFLGSTRVGVVTFHPASAYLEAQPIKLFEYMAAALPVVASNLPRMKEIVEEVGCGLIVNPFKPDEIADALKWLLEHPGEAEEMGKRGREAVLRNYNWGTQAERMLAFYELITNGHQKGNLRSHRTPFAID